MKELADYMVIVMGLPWRIGVAKDHAIKRQ